MIFWYEAGKDGHSVKVLFDPGLVFGRADITPGMIAREALRMGFDGELRLDRQDSGRTLRLSHGTKDASFGDEALRLSLDDFSTRYIAPIVDIAK